MGWFKASPTIGKQRAHALHVQSMISPTFSHFQFSTIQPRFTCTFFQSKMAQFDSNDDSPFEDLDDSQFDCLVEDAFEVPAEASQADLIPLEQFAGAAAIS